MPTLWRMVDGNDDHHGGSARSTARPFLRSARAARCAAWSYDSVCRHERDVDVAAPAHRGGDAQHGHRHATARRTRRDSPSVIGKPLSTLAGPRLARAIGRRLDAAGPPPSAGRGKRARASGCGSSRTAAFAGQRHEGDGEHRDLRKRDAGEQDGHIAAAPIRPDSQSSREPSTRPNSATTAQSKSAEKMRPIDRVMRLMMPWISATRLASVLSVDAWLHLASVARRWFSWRDDNEPPERGIGLLSPFNPSDRPGPCRRSQPTFS